MDFKERGKRGPIDSKLSYIFLIGITLVPLSIVLMVVSFIFQIPFYIHLPLFVLGIIYLIIGLANRGKWKKKIGRITST
jgi:hypothetical protein